MNIFSENKENDDIVLSWNFWGTQTTIIVSRECYLKKFLDPDINLNKLLQSELKDAFFYSKPSVFEMKDFHQLNVNFKFTPFLTMMLLARRPHFEGAKLTLCDEVSLDNIETFFVKSKESGIIPNKSLLCKKIHLGFFGTEVAKLETKDITITIKIFKHEYLYYRDNEPYPIYHAWNFQITHNSNNLIKDGTIIYCRNATDNPENIYLLSEKFADEIERNVKKLLEDSFTETFPGF